MELGILPPASEHLTKPNLVAADSVVAVGALEMSAKQHPDRTKGRILFVRLGTQKREAPDALVAHQPGVTKQTDVARDPRLGDAQHGGQLADVETFPGQQTQQSETSFVAQQAE
tara:strand:+ start:485 stop:826 length:342 start_codon:yes stop_codon:yes gene_type:complete